MNCLQCGAPLDQDFGIVACAQCGAVMMVDMDGKPQLAESGTGVMQIPTAESVASAPAPDADPFSVSENPFSSEVQRPDYEPEQASGELPTENPDFSFQNPEPQAFENPVGGMIQSEEPMVAEEVILQPPPTENMTGADADTGADAENSSSWFDEPAPPPEEPAAPAVDPRLASADFSDVTEFGNQDGDAGALQFELILSGLDHADLQHEVASILSDPRLFLNIKDLGEQMSQGILVIPGLSAARTSLLVSRLRHLKIGIQWRQRLYEV